LTVVYDGECRLCLATVAKLRRMRTRSELRFVALQSVLSGEIAPWPGLEGVAPERLRAQLHVTDAEGRLYGGAEAVLRLLRDVPSLAWLGRLGALPGLRGVSRLLYRLVAKYRYRLFGTEASCASGACEWKPPSNGGGKTSDDR